MNENTERSEFIDLVIWVVLAMRRHLWLVFSIIFLCAIISSFMVLFVLDKKFESTAVIVPPSSNHGSGLKSLMGNFSDALDLFGGGGSDSDEDILFALLHSRDLHLKIIEKFSLDSVYKFRKKKQFFHADLLKEFRKNLRVNETDENFFQISFRDKSAERAFYVIVFIVKAVDSSYNAYLIENAKIARSFLSDRLDSLNLRMKHTEQLFVDFQKRSHMYDPDIQLEESVKAMAKTQVKLEELKIALEIEEQSHGKNTVTYRMLKAKYTSTDKNQRHLASKGSGNGILTGLKNLPNLGLEYANFKREILVQNTLYRILRQQLEEKTLREADTKRKISIIEKPWINNKKVVPPRRIIVMITVAMAFVFSLLTACLLEVLKSEKSADTFRYRMLSEIFSRNRKPG